MDATTSHHSHPEQYSQPRTKNTSKTKSHKTTTDLCCCRSKIAPSSAPAGVLNRVYIFSQPVAAPQSSIPESTGAQHMCRHFCHTVAFCRRFFFVFLFLFFWSCYDRPGWWGVCFVASKCANFVANLRRTGRSCGRGSHRAMAESEGQGMLFGWRCSLMLRPIAYRVSPFLRRYTVPINVWRLVSGFFSWLLVNNCK